MAQPSPDNHLKPWQLWLFLLTETLANGLLSYSSLGPTLKFWIGFLGILFPCLVLMTLPSKAMAGPPFNLTPWRLPLGVWVALWTFMVFTRLYHLTTLAAWPLQDEAMHSYLGMELTQGQRPEMFYTSSQFPPFYIWGLGLFFKLFEPSLFSLWLYPTLLSILTVVLGYAAARFFIPSRFSTLAFPILAFSFWPMVQGRFSHAGVLVLFWQCLAFASAGYFWKAQKQPDQEKRLVLFAVVTGLGFYVFTSWSFIALSFVYLAWLMAKARRIPAGELGKLFLLPLLILASPYFFFLLTNGPMGHYLSSILVPPGASQEFWGRLMNCLTYFSVLGWGGLEKGCYMPNWGGFLNPLLDAFLFLGLVSLLKNRKSPWVRWGVVSFFLMMLPGALTANMECFRVIQVFPFLLVAIAVGLGIMLDGLKPALRPWVMALVLAASLGLDGYHLFDVCPKAWAPGGQKAYSEQGLRFYAFGQAYDLLKETADQSGPGLIWTNLLSPPDPSFIVSTYPFNATRNPKYSQSPSKWGALVVNENLYPFLKARFSQARFSILPPGPDEWDGSLMLVVIPFDPSLAPLFSRLTAADRALQEVTRQTLHLTFQESHRKISQALAQDHPFFAGDPLLESLYWEAVYLHASADQDFPTSLLALLEDSRLGYPTAALYNELGYIRFLQGRIQDAKGLYEKALGCPWSHTSAAQNLENLEARFPALK